MQLELTDQQRQALTDASIDASTMQSEVQFVRALTAKIRELERGQPTEITNVSSVYSTLVGIHTLLAARVATSESGVMLTQ